MGFVDLQWVKKDDGLVQILKRKDRQEFSLGPYKPSLVHQALAYVCRWTRRGGHHSENVDENGYREDLFAPSLP